MPVLDAASSRRCSTEWIKRKSPSRRSARPMRPRAASGFHCGFAEETNETEAAPASRFDWAGLFDDYAPPPKLEEPPVWLDRLSDAEISEDLALDQCRGVSEIRERRRDFALANHPDRVGADYRNAATRRMMVANQLIDAALARLA